MKKGSKRILTILVIGVIVIALIITALYFFYPIPWMTPAATGQILDTNIYAVKNAAGTVYLIKTESGYIAVDAGTGLKKLETSLQEAKIHPADVHSIFLTHSHFDHVKGLPLFSQAQIYMSEDEMPLINGTKNSLPSEIDINKIKLIQGNQEYLFDGTKVSCIQSPGHTIGSMSFLIDGEYLFSGDAFKVIKGTADIHPFTMDAEAAETTIEKLKEISKNCSAVLTAHYGFFEQIK